MVIPAAIREALEEHARAEELPEGAVVVAVLADGGWKYLSASFWSGDEIDETVLWW